MTLYYINGYGQKKAFPEFMSPEPGHGVILDGEHIETFVAPKCGHEMFDESEIDGQGLCVNCAGGVQ
jgi:hypothetical protein